MSKIFDFFEKKEKKKNLFGTELEDLVPSDCLIPTVISKERVIIHFRLEIHGPVSPRSETFKFFSVLTDFSPGSEKLLRPF